MELKKQTSKSSSVYIVWKNTKTLEDLEVNYMIILTII